MGRVFWVLTLLILEFGLGGVFNERSKHLLQVLTLLILEFGLGAAPHPEYTSTTLLGLNPSYTGIWSRGNNSIILEERAFTWS